MSDRILDPETEVLQALSQAINEATFHNAFDTALTNALSQVCEVTGCDYGEAWIPSQDGTVLELSPFWYCRNPDSKSVPAFEQFRICSEAFILSPSIGLPGRVWSSQQPEWIPDVSEHSETYFLRNLIAKACGVKAGFGVPILVNHQVIAVLAFFMSQVRQEDKELIELVVAVATYLGEILRSPIAIEQATITKTGKFSKG